MTLSTGPWWWAPVFALGWITTVPAQSFSAPARACVIAAARFMPGVCGVVMSSSFACTTRTPACFHLDSIGISDESDEGDEVQYSVADDKRPELAVPDVGVRLEKPVGGVERERGNSLIEMVRGADHHADVHRGRHPEARTQRLDHIGADE